MRKPKRLLIVVAVASLAVSGLGLSASAQDQQSSHGPTALLPDASGADEVAVGLIVKTTTSAPSDELLDATDDALGSKTEVVDDDKLITKVSTLEFDEEVSEAFASEVADEIADRADVVWAVPDRLRRAQQDPPIVKDDTHFTRQTNLWDSSYNSPAGGYSIKAPAVWKATEGSPDLTVAVLDTGLIPHPELMGKTVPGYDMVSSATRARDGNGRDSNPKDEGDWEQRNQCYRNSRAYASSWHGTFVAGQIAARTDTDPAVDNNNPGIAAVAPGVKVQPVRVLARCGGTDSDILAGMLWAAGIHVKGVPDNQTPAKVVNLSLSGMARDTVERDKYCAVYNSAAAAGMAAGATYVAAAGNGGTNANLALPAACSKFISVGATSIKGYRALYTNVGSTVDLSAPGGDTIVEGSKDSVLSLGNSGTKHHSTTYTYIRHTGTSMSAPQVSGAAAILHSLGFTDPSSLRAALLQSVSGFHNSSAYHYKRYTYGGRSYTRNLVCATTGKRSCGRGILDLSKVQAPVGEPSVSGKLIDGHAIVGEVLSASGDWVGRPTYTWYRLKDGVPPEFIGTGQGYIPGTNDLGYSLQVRTSGDGAFDRFTTTATVDSVTAAPDVEITSIYDAHVSGETLPVSVKIKPPWPTDLKIEDGQVEILYNNDVVASGTTIDGRVTIEVPAEAWRFGGFWVKARYVGAGLNPSSVSDSVYTYGYLPTPTITTEVATPGTATEPASLRVTVDAPPDDVAAGRLYIYNKSDLGMQSITVGMDEADGGTKTVTLPLLAPGEHQLVVWFYGESRKPATATQTVTVN